VILGTSELRRVVALLAYPVVEANVDHPRLDDESTWRAFIDVAAPPTREALLAEIWPRPFSRETLGTASARARVRRWAEAGRPIADATLISRRLVCVTEREMRDVVVHALATQVPQPVVFFALQNCWVLGLGWSSEGSRSTAPPFPGVLPEPLQLLQLSGASRDVEHVAALFAHELSHSWLLPPASPLEEMESLVEREAKYRGLEEIAIARGRWDVVAELEIPSERAAAALARSWGFRGRAADGEACVRNLRHRLIRRAASLQHDR
jgi:hypothetical protein